MVKLACRGGLTLALYKKGSNPLSDATALCRGELTL
jgi:hypothetical protein